MSFAIRTVRSFARSAMITRFQQPCLSAHADIRQPPSPARGGPLPLASALAARSSPDVKVHIKTMAILNISSSPSVHATRICRSVQLAMANCSAGLVTTAAIGSTPNCTG